MDEELQTVLFNEVTSIDLAANGKLRPTAARHFAEKAERIQNLNAFFQSPAGADPDIKVHFSGIKLARMFEDLLDIKDFDLVLPYVRLAEQANSKRIAQVAVEQVMMEAMTPSGLTHDDYDTEQMPQFPGTEAPPGMLEGPLNEQAIAPGMDQAPEGPGAEEVLGASPEGQPQAILPPS
jgi:hypothetical protein